MHPWNINLMGPHEEFITAGPCDHGCGHDGNVTSTLARTRE